MAVLALLTSCLDGDYHTTYVADCDFEWSDFAEHNPDSIYNKSYVICGNSMVFNSKLDDKEQFGGGFTVSMLCDIVIEPGHVTRSQYCVSDTTGAYYSEGFAVFTQNSDESMMPEHDIIFIQSDQGQAVANYVHVCNTNLLANLMLYGDDTFEPFTAGDYLTLTFTANKSGSSKASVSCDLARYDTKGSKVLINWEKVDLSSLGEFDSIDLTLTSSRPDLPMMCCIDSFRATVNISQSN